MDHVFFHFHTVSNEFLTDQHVFGFFFWLGRARVRRSDSHVLLLRVTHRVCVGDGDQPVEARVEDPDRVALGDRVATEDAQPLDLRGRQVAAHCHHLAVAFSKTPGRPPVNTVTGRGLTLGDARAADYVAGA